MPLEYSACILSFTIYFWYVHVELSADESCCGKIRMGWSRWAFPPFLYNLIRCNQIIFFIRIIFWGMYRMDSIYSLVEDWSHFHSHWAQNGVNLWSNTAGTYPELIETMTLWWAPLLNQNCSRSDAFSLRKSVTQIGRGGSNVYMLNDISCVSLESCTKRRSWVSFVVMHYVWGRALNFNLALCNMNDPYISII